MGFREILFGPGNKDNEHRKNPNLGSERHEMVDEDLSADAVAREIVSIKQRLANPNLTGGERKFLAEKLYNLEGQKKTDLGIAA